MNRALVVGLAVAVQACALSAAVDVIFEGSREGVLDVPGDGVGEGNRCHSRPFVVKTGTLYGFEYSGREVGTGLIVAGSDGVNVDRRGPDAGWYEYKHAYQTRDLPGGTLKDRFHLGHYRGRGEFSFRACRFRELRAVYGTTKGLTLGHGESVLDNRYRFDTALSSFGRNHARTLQRYRAASFNTSHWNNSAGSEVVYRFDLAGRTFRTGGVVVTCGHYVGRDGLVVELSSDGAAWTEAGIVSRKGATRLALPASAFPAKELYIRLRGLAHTSLQVSSFSFEGEVDGDPVTAFGSTQYLDAETGELFGEVKAPVFAELLSGKNAQLVSDAGELSLWSAVSDVKVFRGTPIPENRGRCVSLHLAGNERESVQLVVTPSDEALRNVTVTASDLVRDDRTRLPASAVTVERVGYVRVEVPTDEAGAPGLWPDPLLPQDAARPCGVEVRQNQPFWVTVRTPKRAAPGVYRGELTVAAELVSGVKRGAKVPLEVEVFDFDLPDRMSCETAFGFSPARVARFHRVKVGSAEHDQILEKYIQMLADSHVGVYRWGKGDFPKLSWENAQDPERAEPKFDWLEFDDAHAEMWGRFHCNAFRIPIEGLGNGFQDGFQAGKICGVPATNAVYQTLMGKYLGAFEEHLRQKGWLDTSYVYWFDEPQQKCYRFVNAGMETMKRHAPGIRRMITNECTDELDNVNLWNPRLDHFFSGAYGKYRARGDQFWWYICCGPHAPYPTEFIDHPGDELRAWLWMTWGENVRGILIWETTLWTSASTYPDSNRPQNPYIDAMSWSGSGGTWGNGDGRFVYPPLAAVETPYAKGQPAIMDAPNGSYRLAILRDGIEDYEYFALLRKADPANALLKVPESVYRSVRDFSSDPTAMREHRLKLAREIARLGAGAPRTEPETCVGTWSDGTASSYRADKWRKVRHEGKMAEIAARAGKPCDLVLLGDSITELWEWKAPRWGANELAKLQAKADTLALGYGGDRIQDVLYRVEHGELDGYEARHVAIMIGTNNRGCTPEDMAAGLAKLLVAVRAKQPKAKVVVYATFPCRQTWRNLRNRAANPLYAQVAAAAGAEFRDINGKLPLELFPDGLHPNEKGYAIWRDDLEQVLAVRPDVSSER